MRARAIYVLVDEEDYLELKKRLLEERKSLAQWVRERIKEYLKGAPEIETRWDGLRRRRYGKEE